MAYKKQNIMMKTTTSGLMENYRQVLGLLGRRCRTGRITKNT